MTLKSHLFPKEFKFPLVAPSVLSCRFAELGQELAVCAQLGLNWIHVDVMDGHFVDNLTLGPPILKAMSKSHPRLFYDTHLMVEHPEKWIEVFKSAGSSSLTVHAETFSSVDDTRALLKKIKFLGMRAGLSLRPQTPFEKVRPFLSDFDLLLIMSVNPGFGGQAFIPAALETAERARVEREAEGLSFVIQMDGGMNAQTIPFARQSGVDCFVSGSAFFEKADRKKALSELTESFSNP